MTETRVRVRGPYLRPGRAPHFIQLGCAVPLLGAEETGSRAEPAPAYQRLGVLKRLYPRSATRPLVFYRGAYKSPPLHGGQPIRRLSYGSHQGFLPHTLVARIARRAASNVLNLAGTERSPSQFAGFPACVGSIVGPGVTPCSRRCELGCLERALSDPCRRLRPSFKFIPISTSMNTSGNFYQYLVSST